jgi:hypothetical protein
MSPVPIRSGSAVAAAIIVTGRAVASAVAAIMSSVAVASPASIARFDTMPRATVEACAVAMTFALAISAAFPAPVVTVAEPVVAIVRAAVVIGIGWIVNPWRGRVVSGGHGTINDIRIAAVFVIRVAGTSSAEKRSKEQS